MCLIYSLSFCLSSLFSFRYCSFNFLALAIAFSLFSISSSSCPLMPFCSSTCFLISSVFLVKDCSIFSAYFRYCSRFSLSIRCEANIFSLAKRSYSKRCCWTSFLFMKRSISSNFTKVEGYYFLSAKSWLKLDPIESMHLSTAFLVNLLKSCGGFFIPMRVEMLRSGTYMMETCLLVAILSRWVYSKDSLWTILMEDGMELRSCSFSWALGGFSPWLPGDSVAGLMKSVILSLFYSSSRVISIFSSLFSTAPFSLLLPALLHCVWLSLISSLAGLDASELNSREMSPTTFLSSGVRCDCSLPSSSPDDWMSSRSEGYGVGISWLVLFQFIAAIATSSLSSDFFMVRAVFCRFEAASLLLGKMGSGIALAAYFFIFVQKCMQSIITYRSKSHRAKVLNLQEEGEGNFSRQCVILCKYGEGYHSHEVAAALLGLAGLGSYCRLGHLGLCGGRSGEGGLCLVDVFLGDDAPELERGVLGDEAGQILELVDHHQVLPVHLLLVEVVVRRVDVPHVDRDRHAWQGLPDQLYCLHSRVEVAHPVLRADHVGDHHDLGVGIVEDGLAFLDPLPEFLRGGDLEEDGGVAELLDELVEDVPALVGLIVDPEDVVIGGLGHLLRRVHLLQLVDRELVDLPALHVRQPLLHLPLDLRDPELSERLQQQFLLIAEVGELVDGLSGEDVHFEEGERQRGVGQEALDGELQGHLDHLGGGSEGLEGEQLALPPLGVVVHPAEDRPLHARDPLQVLEQRARVPVHPGLTELLWLLEQHALAPEVPVEGIVDLADLSGLLVLVLEVAGVDEDGLDVLLVLEVGLLDGAEALVDHLIALVALVELLGGDVQLLEGELPGVLALQQLRDLLVEDHLLVDEVAHQAHLAQLLQLLDRVLQLQQPLAPADDEVHHLQADRVALVVLLPLLQEELRVYLLHHHPLDLVVVQLQRLACLACLAARLLLDERDDVLLAAALAELQVLAGGHDLDLAVVIELPVVGDHLRHLQRDVLAPTDAELLDVLLVKLQTKLVCHFLEEALNEGGNPFIGVDLHADDELTAREEEVEGELLLLLEAILEADVVHESALVHEVALRLPLFLILLEPLEGEEHHSVQRVPPQALLEVRHGGPHRDDVPLRKGEPEVLAGLRGGAELAVALEEVVEGEGVVAVGDDGRLAGEVQRRLLRVGEVEDHEIAELRAHVSDLNAVIAEMRSLLLVLRGELCHHAQELSMKIARQCKSYHIRLPVRTVGSVSVEVLLMVWGVIINGGIRRSSWS